MNKRGLIIYPTIHKARTYHHQEDFDRELELEIIYEAIDPALLRLYVLYWDLLDWPKNNIVPLDAPGPAADDANLLMKEGLLKRSNIIFPKNTFGAFLPFAIQAIAFIENNKKQNEDWSLAQNQDKLILPKEYSTIERSIEIELYRSIPVPTENVSIDDVLRFKEKRRDELHYFRHTMDNLYLQVIQSRDIPRAKTHAIDEIQQSVIDLNKVFKETRLPSIHPTFKVELNISDLITYSVAGTIGASQVGFPLALGAIIGAAASALKIKVESVPTMKKYPKKFRDFAYLCYLDKELQKKKHRRRLFKKKSQI